MPSNLDLGQLRQIGLFGALTEEALGHFVDSLEVQEYSPGQQVFVEGQQASEFFVLLNGEMEVLKKSRAGVEARVAMLGPSDWFGEMSILDVQPRSATVRALAPSRALRITAADLDALYRRDLKSYALVVLNIARELSRRLRVMDSLLADFVGVTEQRRTGG